MIVVRSVAGIDRARLNPKEQERLSGFRYARRKREWLLGRSALKQLLPALNRSDDTTSVTFPGSRVSLTHAGDIAYAAGISAEGCGIGIDYEPLRQVDIRVARWLLGDSESDWLNQQPESARAAQLVRLWTVKEAAFKSHPDNAQMALGDFSISEPSAFVSTVVTKVPCIKVTSRACDSGYLSAAIFTETP